jgi:hypothetical protein
LEPGFVKHLQVCLSLLSRTPRKLEMLLLLVLLWLSAGLFWQVFGPSRLHGSLAMPVSPPTEAPFIPTGLIKWFEVRQDAAQPVADLKLVALVSGPQGVAVIGGLPDGDKAVRVGDEIRAGAKLLAIHSRSVEIEQDGARRTLELPAAPDVDAVLVPVNKAVPAHEAGVMPPPGISAPVAQAAPPKAEAMAVSRGSIGGAIQTGNIADWNKGISTYRDGGILVEDAAIQPIAKAFKLNNGDVMKSVNGRPINNLADISLVFNAFSQHAEVELTVLRDGAQQTLRYQIQP